MENAKINASEVDLVSAHATATKMGDIIEAQAISDVFGPSPYVVGLKSYMGHTMAACGAIETIMSLYMMQEGFIAPTLNLEEIDERCAMVQHVQKIIRAAGENGSHTKFRVWRRQHHPADKKVVLRLKCPFFDYFSVSLIFA